VTAPRKNSQYVIGINGKYLARNGLYYDKLAQARRYESEEEAQNFLDKLVEDNGWEEPNIYRLDS
jgi:hypothetical protein